MDTVEVEEVFACEVEEGDDLVNMGEVGVAVPVHRSVYIEWRRGPAFSGRSFRPRDVLYRFKRESN